MKVTHVVTGANLSQRPILNQNSSVKVSFLLPCGKSFYSGVDKPVNSISSSTFMKQKNEKGSTFQMFTIKL